MYTCPCCQHEVEGEGFYDICPRCKWEVDSCCSEWDLEHYCWVNHLTLGEGRTNYNASGVCDPGLVV